MSRSSDSQRRRYGILLAILFLGSGLFFGRVYKGTVTFYGHGDDDLYWASGRRLVYEGNFDFSKEPLLLFCNLPPGFRNFATPFPGLLWSPSIALGRLLTPLIAQFPGVPPEAVQHGYSDYHRLLISAFAGTLSLIGVLFFFALIAELVSPRAALPSAFLLLLGTPLMYYTFRRVLMAHSAEIAVLGALSFISYRFICRPSAALGFWTGLLAALLAGVRYPDAIVVIAWFAALLWFKPVRKDFPWRTGLWVLLGAALPALIQVGIWKAVWNAWRPDSGMYAMTGSNFLHNVRITGTTLRRLADLFIGPGWGFFWMEPVVLLALFSTLLGRGRVAHLARIVAVVCSPLLLIAANFGSQGGSYGYRYLLAKELWLALGLAVFVERYGQRVWCRILLMAVTIPSILCLLLFESGPPELTLHLEHDWVNDGFARHALATAILHPGQLAAALTGTPVGHVLLVMWNHVAGLGAFPEAVRAKALERILTIPLAPLFWYWGWLSGFSLLAGWVFDRYVFSGLHLKDSSHTT